MGLPAVRRPDTLPEPTALDRAIEVLSPSWGNKRRRERIRGHLTDRLASYASAYVGAESERRSLRTWRPWAGSAEADILSGLGDLRGRSRDLARNAPLATGAINTNVTNVVGSGIRLQARPDRELLGLDDEAATEWEHRAEQIWNIWATSTACDITCGCNFYELTSLVFRSVLESGALLSIRRFVERPGTLLSTAVQIVEADRISNPDWMPDRPGLAGGVEHDRDGRPIAYHVMTGHPGDLMLHSAGRHTWSRVPARGTQSGELLATLLYRRLRPGQLRGVPYLAPVIEPLKQLDRYTEAEIMAAVVSSMFTVFIESEGGEEDFTAGLADLDGAPSTEPAEYKLGSGTMVDLMKGEKATFANPTRPNPAFDPFMTAVLRQIGTALELPFEVLVKHFTNSYSAARAALLEAWKHFRTRREWLASGFCQPTYEWVLAEAISRGLLSAPGFLDDPAARYAWSRAEWIGPAAGQIDPLKEVNAAKARVDLGVSTLAEETAQMSGGDWETKHRQRAKEAAMRRRDGLDVEVVGELNVSQSTQKVDPTDEDPDEADRGEENEE